MVLFDSCAPLGGNCEGAVAICCGCPERKGGRGCNRGWIDGHNHDTLVAVHQKVHAQNWAAPAKNACTIPLDWDVPEPLLPTERASQGPQRVATKVPDWATTGSRHGGSSSAQQRARG